MRPESRFLFCSGVILFLLLFPVVGCAVEYHALLVGVGGQKKPLAGPKNDVAVLREVLIERYGFPPGNIKSLVEEEATKAAILQEIDNLNVRSKSGDHIFLYYSGHGTSKHDGIFGEKLLTLPHDSGALVAYDSTVAGDLATIQRSLIVGRRDLVPRLRKLEKNRLVLAVFDSCFSQNSVRGRMTAISRFMPLDIEEESFPVATGSFGKTKKSEPFPYKNIFYISSASESQKAWEADRRIPYTTVDGKPHGLFTDQLLRALTGKLPIDTNNDGKMSFGELFQVLKKNTVAISAKYCPNISTPHHLPENFSLQSKSFFRSVIKPTSQDSLSSSLLIADKEYPNQKFNVTVDLLGKHGDTVTVGDSVGYSMYTEEDAYLMLINIGPTGTLHVIYPYYESELGKAKAQKNDTFGKPW